MKRERTAVMKIYFIRHGDPNYRDDCLTEKGHVQAEIAAKNLCNSGIEAIYSSSQGRARQTAEYTAKKLGLDVQPCDFIREIRWDSIDGSPLIADGHPWNVSQYRISHDLTLVNDNWREDEQYRNSRVVESVKIVADGVDEWLATLGFVREGEYYRVSENIPYKTVAMFSHAGASGAAISHMLNIPFPQFCAAFSLNFVSSFVVNLADKPGELVYPQIKFIDDVLYREEKHSQIFYGN